MKNPCTSDAVLCDLCGLAEDAIEATGMRAWSIIDARAGTITLHVEYPPMAKRWRGTDARSSNGKTPDSTSGDASSILCTGCQP